MDSKASRLLFLTSDKSRSLFKMRSNSCHDGQIHTLNIIHSFSHNISLILTVQKNILFSHAIKFTEPGGGGEMRNSAFGLRFHKTQLKKKKKITMQTVTVCPTTLSCTFWQPELCMCNQLGTPRWIILCTAQITYRRPGHGYCKKVASYLMLKNKTLFIETLRSLFLAAVNQGQLTGRKFQYFSFH